MTSCGATLPDSTALSRDALGGARIDIQQLLCFVTVADEGSFTNAAAVLHLSQPRLSQAVAGLETELGYRLLHRANRGTSLTREGETFIKSAREVLHSVDNAYSTASSIRGVMSGRLNVVAMFGFAMTATQVVAAFRAEYPEVAVHFLTPSEDERVFALVEAGGCDIGFALANDRGGATPGVEWQEVAVMEAVAILPKQSPQGRRRGPITLEEVAELPFISSRRGTWMRNRLERLLGDAGLEVRIGVESDHHESSIELVRHGAGAYLTIRGGLPARAEQFVTIRPLKPARHPAMGLVHRADHLPPAAAAFKDVALRHLRVGGRGHGTGTRAQ